MLYIITKDGKEICSHIGDKFPNRSWDNINEVQADGHELMSLYQHFPDLPRYNGTTVTFIGETAQFIVANLCNKKW